MLRAAHSPSGGRPHCQVRGPRARWQPEAGADLAHASVETSDGHGAAAQPDAHPRVHLGGAPWALHMAGDDAQTMPVRFLACLSMRAPRSRAGLRHRQDASRRAHIGQEPDPYALRRPRAALVGHSLCVRRQHVRARRRQPYPAPECRRGHRAPIRAMEASPGGSGGRPPPRAQRSRRHWMPGERRQGGGSLAQHGRPLPALRAPQRRRRAGLRRGGRPDSE